MNPNPDKPTIAITLGDINGIGPEVTVQALADEQLLTTARFLVFGSAEAFERATHFVPDGLQFDVVESLDKTSDASVLVIDDDTFHPPVSPGLERAEAGAAAHHWICEACACVQRGDADALVTAPISKAAIFQAGLEDMGHTELLARLTATASWRMTLAFREKLVAHITGHLPLRDAIEQVRRDRILETIFIVHEALQDMGIERPRIAVPGLNPHAGEQGSLGTEDIEEVAPAVASAREAGIDCTGPVPPDAVFRQLFNNRYDGLVALYHDQGHIPVKLLAMNEGVNVTLGLPIVRTSPDHGTAYDIAWKNTADPSSMQAAIRLAIRMAAGKRRAPAP